MIPVDLLVFGPHPDDIEIGLGGTIARHTAEGYSVGLCDLTRGELASNGTAEERHAEARPPRVRSARRGARTWAGPTAASPRRQSMLRSAVDLIRRHGRARSPFRTGTIAIRITSRRVTCCATAAFRSGSAPLRDRARRLAARLGLLLLHQRRRAAVVRRRRVGALSSASATALDCYRSQFAPADAGRGGDAADGADVPPARSRAATRSSARWPAWRSPKASSSASRSARRSLLKHGS